MSDTYYLSQKAKQQLVSIAVFGEFMDDCVKEWAESHPKKSRSDREKNRIKWGKMARTYADKTFGTFWEGLDEEQKRDVLSQIEKVKVYVMYTDKALRERRKRLQAEEVVAVDHQDFLDVCEQALGVCQFCDNISQKVERCDLRRLFLKYDVEPFTLHPEKGACCYKVEGGEQK